MSDHRISLPLDEYQALKRRIDMAQNVLKVVPKKWGELMIALNIVLTSLHKQHDIAKFLGDANDAQDRVKFDITDGKITVVWTANPIEDEDEDTDPFSDVDANAIESAEWDTEPDL